MLIIFLYTEFNSIENRKKKKRFVSVCVCI